jgi:hypothetical protein
MDISHCPSLASDLDQATTGPENARRSNPGGVHRKRVLPISLKSGRVALVHDGQFNFFPVNYLLSERTVFDLESGGRSVRPRAGGAHGLAATLDTSFGWYNNSGKCSTGRAEPWSENLAAMR